MSYALYLARTQMFGQGAPADRARVRNVAIILTDGKPTGGNASALRAAAELRDSGVRIISIGVTRRINENLLRDMSSPPRTMDQDYFRSPDFNKLNPLLHDIIRSACLTTTTTKTTTMETTTTTTTPVLDPST